LINFSTKMTEAERPKNATLADFIKDNYTLITSLAAFVALTAFSFQLDNPEAKLGLSAAALFGALLLGIELFFRLPPRPHHWRLVLFDLVLLALFGELGRYWFLHFTVVWVPAVVAFSPVLTLVFLSAGITLLLRAVVKFVATRIFKRSLDAERFERGSQFAFLFIMALLLATVIWGLHRIDGHQFHIKLPWLSR